MSLHWADRSSVRIEPATSQLAARRCLSYGGDWGSGGTAALGQGKRPSPRRCRDRRHGAGVTSWGRLSDRVSFQGQRATSTAPRSHTPARGADPGTTHGSVLMNGPLEAARVDTGHGAALRAATTPGASLAASSGVSQSSATLSASRVEPTPGSPPGLTAGPPLANRRPR